MGFLFLKLFRILTIKVMLYITRGDTTRVAVTLQEKQTLTSPYWLWRFISDTTNVEVTAVIAEVSNNYKERSNLFDITEGVTVTLIEGIYTYYVYEQASSNNTDYRLATSCCEIGQIKVDGDGAYQFSSPQYTVEYPTA